MPKKLKKATGFGKKRKSNFYKSGSFVATQHIAGKKNGGKPFSKAAKKKSR